MSGNTGAVGKAAADREEHALRRSPENTRGARVRSLMTRVTGQYTAPMKWLLLRMIEAYRLMLSPFFGTQCRFYPTCSAYALEAIETHGSLKGSWLAVKRIARCGPWHPGGPDPVPPKVGSRKAEGEGRPG